MVELNYPSRDQLPNNSSVTPSELNGRHM